MKWNGFPEKRQKQSLPTLPTLPYADKGKQLCAVVLFFYVFLKSPGQFK